MVTRRIAVIFHLTLVLLLCNCAHTGSTISLFHNCDGKIRLSNSETQRVEIEGSAWSSATGYTCIITFESPKRFNLIYSQFDSFIVNDQDIQIILESSNAKGSPYTTEGTYSKSHAPSLSTPNRAERFFKITVRRVRLASYDVSILMDVYTEAYYKEHYTTERANGLKVGQIAGIIIGCVSFIIVIITVIVCCVIGMKYPHRRGSIYSVARRLSIFATTPTPDTRRTEGSDTESELKPDGKRGSGGKGNPAYSDDRAHRI